MILSQKFHKRLQRIANEKKITQADLARALEKSTATISKWWSGHIIPGPRNMQVLAEYFGCNLDWLIEGTGEPFQQLQTAESVSNFSTRKKEKDDRLESVSLERMRFKLQRAPVYFEQLFDFIFDTYGDDQAAADQFLKEIFQSHANYRRWLEEKKQENGNHLDIPQKQVSVNGE